MARIAVVDDDQKLLDLLAGYLKENNHDPIPFRTPRAFLAENPGGFDLVILDILMPEMDGFEVLRRLRKNSSLPVIMLTARGDVYDRIVGLELGADDYLPKPFEPRELLARIEAVLRRMTIEKPSFEQLMYEEFTFIPDSMQLSIQGVETTLTSAEFELLYYLCTNPFRVLSRDMIMENTKEISWESFDRSVDVLVSRLRKKLGDDPASPRIIRTIWGEGYMFIAKRQNEAKRKHED
jgi:two-component system phosphate regulon response regulator OmpR